MRLAVAVEREIDGRWIAAVDPIGTLGQYIYSDSARNYRTPPSERVSREALEKAVLARALKGTEEMNRKALQAGFAAAEGIKSPMP